VHSPSFYGRKDTPPAPRGPTLQALYAELAARDRELARLRAQLGGLRCFGLGSDAAGGPGERHRFDLMAAVDAAVRATQEELAGVIVCVRIQPLAVHGSLAAITQVLVHLLVNAGAAMRDTGRPGVVHIDAAQRGPRVHLRLADNGRGIAPEVMGRIFEPFFSTGGAGMGLGLGLTISGAIVRAHGGLLSCSNRSPHGARFAFDMPGAPGARTPPADPRRPAGAGRAADGAAA
jgi:C4-dicarboxylate-specific signal transduction histidine kinase